MAIHKEDITILNLYAPNNSFKLHKAKLIELKKDKNKSTSVIGDHNTYLSMINRARRKKISKAMKQGLA